MPTVKNRRWSVLGHAAWPIGNAFLDLCHSARPWRPSSTAGGAAQNAMGDAGAGVPARRAWLPGLTLPFPLFCPLPVATCSPFQRIVVP